MPAGIAEEATVDQPRLGPRPLPLHLATAWAMALGDLLPLGEGPEDQPRPAGADQTGRGRAASEAATVEEALTRLRDFLAGVEAYWRHPYRRRLPDPPILWCEGATRLLDYAPGAGPDDVPLLVVPSLVNRAYILDLAEDRSLLRWLAARGIRPLLVDWGVPGSAERELDLTGYIAGRLTRAQESALAAVGRPTILLGYCMGGLLALALALRRPAGVAGLALLATPWDFDAVDRRLRDVLTASREPLGAAIDLNGALPVDVLQALFAGLDPKLTPRKLARFATLDPEGEEAAAFVALEDWVNDGVPLPPAVARECLWGWFEGNTPGRGMWRIAGETVRPEALLAPAFVAVPRRDRIVPRASAEALARALPRAEICRPHAGHIGMVVGRTARGELWEPLLHWTRRAAGRYQQGDRVNNY